MLGGSSMSVLIIIVLILIADGIMSIFNVEDRHL